MYVCMRGVCCAGYICVIAVRCLSIKLEFVSNWDCTVGIAKDFEVLLGRRCFFFEEIVLMVCL
jgi:hypothetical protein